MTEWNYPWFFKRSSSLEEVSTGVKMVLVIKGNTILNKEDYPKQNNNNNKFTEDKDSCTNNYLRGTRNHMTKTGQRNEGPFLPKSPCP